MTTTWTCNIRFQALTVARKCELSHWSPCGSEGRVDGGPYGQVTTKIHRMEMEQDAMERTLRRRGCGTN